MTTPFLPTKIILRNNRIDVLDPNPQVLNLLSKVLTVYDDYAAYPCPLWRGMVTRSIDGHQAVSIPRFISKQLVNELATSLNSTAPVYISDSINPKRIQVQINAEPRNELQQSALEYMFPNGNRYFDQSIKILNLPVGEGKTYLAIKALSKLGVKANIFVHKLTMIETPWIKDILKFTDIKAEEIGIICDGHPIEKAIENADKYKIFITVHRTFSNLAAKPDGEKQIDEMYKALGIGLNIIDEAHLEMLSTFMIAMYTKVKFTLYLTATLGKTDRSERKLFYKTIPAFASFANNNFVEAKRFITYRPRPFKVEGMDDKWKKRFTVEKGVRLNTYSDYLISNPPAYEQLKLGILTAIDEVFAVNPDAHIAVILGTLELISNLKEDIYTYYQGKYEIGNFTTMVKVKDRSAEIKKPIVLSTEKGLNSAIDSAIDAMILCTSNTSDILLTQLIGRIRYKDENKIYPVYDIFDTSIGKLKYNFDARRNTIKRLIAKDVE